MTPHVNKGHRYTTNKQISFSKCSGKSRKRVARRTKQKTIPFYFFPLKKKKSFARSCYGDGPLQGPLSNTGKWIVRGDTCTDKAKDCIGKEWSSRKQSMGTQENCSSSWLSLGFLVLGLVPRLSVASRLACAPIWSSPGPFPGGRAHLSVKMDSNESFWEVVRTLSGLVCHPSFWPLPESPNWSCRYLVSSLFSVRTSCCETTYASGYFYAWPGWVVLVLNRGKLI